MKWAAVKLLFSLYHRSVFCRSMSPEISTYLCLTFVYPLRSGNITIYSVIVGDQTPTMKIEAIFTDMLEPYPAEITQNEVIMNRILKLLPVPLVKQ